VDLEWGLSAVLMDPADPDRPAPEGPNLNATLQSFQVVHPVEELLLRASREASPDLAVDPREARPGVVFAWRHPTSGAAHLCRADDGLLLVFKMVHDRDPVEDVARASGCDIRLIQAHGAGDPSLISQRRLETGHCATRGIPGAHPIR
jgi:hypothetical protein